MRLGSSNMMHICYHIPVISPSNLHSMYICIYLYVTYIKPGPKDCIYVSLFCIHQPHTLGIWVSSQLFQLWHIHGVSRSRSTRSKGPWLFRALFFFTSQLVVVGFLPSTAPGRCWFHLAPFTMLDSQVHGMVRSTTSTSNQGGSGQWVGSVVWW